MFFFRAKRKIEDSVVSLSLEVAALKKELEEIREKLPGYEEAVSRGVDEVWNRAVQSVADYNPYARREAGDS
jgi:hypothetical protein